MRLLVIALIAMMFFAGKVMANDTPTTNGSSVFGLPDHILGDLVAATAFGLVTVLLSIFAYKVIDWALKGVEFDKELAKGNIAVGIFCAAIVLGICHAVSSVVVAIIH
jgi:hypothetical protein